MTEKKGDVGVFISYIRENREEVLRLVDDLRRSGIRVWFAEDNIKAGQYWKDVIKDAIQRGSFFIACFSKEFNERNKSHMHEEITVAIEELRNRPKERAWFIPVLLSGEIPNRSISAVETLRDLQWVDLRQGWDDGIRKILSTVAPMLEKRQSIIDMLNRFHPEIRKKIINLEEEVFVDIKERYINEFYKIAEFFTHNKLFKIKRSEEKAYGIKSNGSWLGFIITPLKKFKDIINDPNFKL